MIITVYKVSLPWQYRLTITNRENKKMFNWLFGEKKKTYTWNTQNIIDGGFPVVDGCEDLNQSKNTGRKRVMRMLLEGQYLSSLQMAKEYDETRLGARIYELRHYNGFNIQDMWVTPESGKKYKEYYFKVNEVVK